MIDRPLETFSVAFKERAFNELDYARQVATAIKADAARDRHRRDATSSARCRGWSGTRTSRSRTPRACRCISCRSSRAQHVKVVLTGEGSDELLAGYGKYPRALGTGAPARVYERWRPSRCAQFMTGTIVPRLPGRVARYAKRSFLAMPRTPEAMFFDNFAAIGLAAAGVAARPALQRAGLGGRATPPRGRTSTRRTARARCSIACSTRT